MSNWKKGALHTHTFWSDAKSLPETVANVYRDELKFDFVCITDHNIFPDIPELWFPVTANDFDIWPPLLSAAEVIRARELPGGIVEKRTGVRTFVRLKTFDELKAQWDIPGKFLLIGGCELTGGHYPDETAATRDIHLNVINCHQTLTPPQRQETPADTFKKSVEVCCNAINSSGSNAMLMLNHPFWRYWDIDPALAVESPEIGFMEICNDGADPASTPAPAVNTPEKYWDFVLASRISSGQPVIYGTATDDAHYYSPERINGRGGCGNGWVMVNCPGEMTTEKLINAMKAGDFYASCGVSFEKIDFDRDSRTLHVKIAPEAGVKYTIRFIVTKKDFSGVYPQENIRHENPRFSRTLPVIGEDIGVEALTIDGIEGSYTMAADDLYVRAEAVSDTPGKLQCTFYPEKQKAWTQPFTGK